MQYLGIDWAYRRAAWCARGESGAITGEGVVPADEDGLIQAACARARRRGAGVRESSSHAPAIAFSLIALDLSSASRRVGDAACVWG